MNEILEKIYYEWLEELKDSEEIDRIQKELDEYDDILKEALPNRKFFEHDDLIMNFAYEHQKQGFIAGFEICKKLLLGGK